jgi:hypothetical protein
MKYAQKINQLINYNTAMLSLILPISAGRAPFVILSGAEG